MAPAVADWRDELLDVDYSRSHWVYGDAGEMARELKSRGWTIGPTVVCSPGRGGFTADVPSQLLAREIERRYTLPGGMVPKLCERPDGAK